MNKPSKFLTIVIGAVLAAGSQLPASPAGAATEVLTPVSEVNWLRGDVTNVAFDPSGRLWAWNVGYLGENGTGMRTNVFTVDGSNAMHWSKAFKPKKFTVNDLGFDSSGTLYASNFTKTILVTKFKSNGKVKKSTKVKLAHIAAHHFVTSNDHLYTIFEGKIDEYLLPLTTHASPIRTLTTTSDNYAQIAADDSGNIYVTQSDVYDGGVDVFTPSQSGSVSPDHSFTIDPTYGDGYITDITFTESGNLAVGYAGVGIAIFSIETTGSDQIPLTWFPDTDNSYYVGLAFDGLGAMPVYNLMELFDR
jgi:hypothetical protein